MYQQDIKGKKLSPLAGIGMILLIVLSICAAGIIEQVIRELTGARYTSIFVWALAAVEVFFLLRQGVREYRYTVTEGRLFIESRYGDSTRLLYDIALSSVCALGPEQEIFERYGSGQAYDKVFTRGCSQPLSALAYRKSGEIRLLLFQPDGKMRELITSHILPDETE